MRACSVGSAAFNDPLGVLAGDFRNKIEVGVIVEHSKFAIFGD